MSLAVLHREVEEQKQKQKTLPTLKHNQSVDNMNTTQKIIEKSKI